MSNQVLPKTHVGHLIENHQKLDRLVSELMNSEVRIHDISDETDRTRDKMDNSSGKPSTPSLKNLGQPKFNEVYSQVESTNKMEKLYKENIDLQKKNMTLQADNQTKKYKAELWDKVRKFIIEQVHPYLELSSVRYGSSDTALIDDFSNIVKEMVSHYLKQSELDGADHT